MSHLFQISLGIAAVKTWYQGFQRPFTAVHAVLGYASPMHHCMLLEVHVALAFKSAILVQGRL